MAVRFNIRQLVEDRLRQFALFEVEHAIILQQELASMFFIALLGVEVFAALFQVFDLSENYDRALLVFEHVASQLGTNRRARTLWPDPIPPKTGPAYRPRFPHPCSPPSLPPPPSGFFVSLTNEVRDLAGTMSPGEGRVRMAKKRQLLHARTGTSGT